MSHSSKKLIFVIIVAVLYYIVFFTFRFTVVENGTLMPRNYQISETCIVVRGQAVTGPEIRVQEGGAFLATQIPLPHPSDFNVAELEMTGKFIFDNVLAYPDYYACDWLVYGKVTGTTDDYAVCGSGTIPVFEAEKIYPLLPLSDYLLLEARLYSKFPLGFLVAGLFYLWPVAEILVVLLKNKSKRRD